MTPKEFVIILSKHRERTKGKTISESNALEIYHNEDMFIKELLELVDIGSTQ